ncbi:ubiquitin-specific protease ubp2, partial [Elasticomyces elasticus]
PKDVYAALDAAFDPDERGSTEVYTTITKLPPIVSINLQRAVVDERGQQIKLNHHVDMPQTLYMDRYLDVPETDVLVQCRIQTWAAKKQLRAAKARLTQLEPNNSDPVDVVMHNASETMDIIGVDHDLIEQISHFSHITREERDTLHAKSYILEQQLTEAFTDSTFRKHEYVLHAAFFHRGTVGSGHYWVYIYDHIAELWRKYNDDHVTHVTDLNEIFGDPANNSRNPYGATPANAYVLVYVRSDQVATGKLPGVASIVETVKREPMEPFGPQQQSAVDTAHSTYARDNGYGDGSGQNLHAIGTDPEMDADGYRGNQQSQMSSLPPDAIDNQFIGPMSAPSAVLSKQVVDDTMADEDEDTRVAIEMSLRGGQHDRPADGGGPSGEMSGVEARRVNTMDNMDVATAAMMAHEEYAKGKVGQWDDREVLARPGTW